MKGQSYQSKQLLLAIFEQSLKRPQYEVWNMASLVKVIAAIEGKFGEKGHELGVQLAEGFYGWYVGKSYGVWEYVYSYSSETGDSFPHSTEIMRMIDEAKAKYDLEYVREHTIDEVTE